MFTLMPMTNRSHSYVPSLFDDRVIRSMFDVLDPLPTVDFRVDVKETPEAFQLSAELPGVKPEELSLNVESDVLTIEADLNSERKEEHSRYVYTERRTGHLRRSFSLEGIDQEQITANYVNGVLAVTLPKQRPEATKGPRKIAIGGAVQEAAPVEVGTAAQETQPETAQPEA